MEQEQMPRDILVERLRRGEEELFKLLWRAIEYYKGVLSGDVEIGKADEGRVRAAGEVIRMVGGLVLQYSRMRMSSMRGGSDAEAKQGDDRRIQEISGWIRRIGGVG